MLTHSACRLFFPSIRSQTSNISALKFYATVSASDRFYSRIQANPSNVEKALASVTVKLDACCVGEVIGRCDRTQFKIGLRFFIWAGTQSGYRHSPFMYNKACAVFEIRSNPGVIKGVVNAYRTEKCPISVKTLRIVLNLCNQARLSDEALWVLRKMPEFNLRADTPSYNLVIRSFVDKGDLSVADKLMKEMESMDLYPDVITYASMINGFCNTGKLEEAWRLVQAMKTHGCVAGAVTFSRLLEGCCQSGRMDMALDLLEAMEKEGGGCNPNTVTYTLVIQAFCKRNKFQEALKILDRMENQGYPPNRVTASILINGVLEDKERKDLSKLIDRLIKMGGVSIEECYSSAVISLGRMTRWEEAEKLFRQMLGCGMRPDDLACSLILREVCSQERYLDCFCLYEEIEKANVKSAVPSDVSSALLLGLCKHEHSAEVAKLSIMMADKKIRLNDSCVERVVDYLKKVGM